MKKLGKVIYISFIRERVHDFIKKPLPLTLYPKLVAGISLYLLSERIFPIYSNQDLMSLY